MPPVITRAKKNETFPNKSNEILADRLRNRRKWFTLEENFQQRPALNAIFAPALTGNDAADAAEIVALNIANRNWEVLGTNMTTALATFAAGGGITLTTAGADADQAILTPHLDTNQTAWASASWSTNKEMLFSVVFETAANITNLKLWTGFKLTNTPVTVTDNDQLFLRYEDDVSSGAFVFNHSYSGTDVENVSSIAPAVSQRFHYICLIDRNRIPYHYLNNELIYTGLVAMTASVTLIPYFGIMADGAAAAKAATVRQIVCSQRYS